MISKSVLSLLPIYSKLKDTKAESKCLGPFVQN